MPYRLDLGLLTHLGILFRRHEVHKVKPAAVQHATSTKFADKVLRWENGFHVIPAKSLLAYDSKYQLLGLVQQLRLFGEVDLGV